MYKGGIALHNVRGISEITDFSNLDVNTIVDKVKRGEIELCFYYSCNETIIKHAYMHKTLKYVKAKYPISFSTWWGFHMDNIHIDKDNSNLDLLCVKTKKWASDLMDRNAVETILDFMYKARFFKATTRESTLCHIVLNGIEKGVYLIPLTSDVKS